ALVLVKSAPHFC
ncbi:hypothetical protein A2U01_0082944, partial [Trifolium medium]|nr:hypothetical protein [Trifolium medium]